MKLRRCLSGVQRDERNLVEKINRAHGVARDLSERLNSSVQIMIFAKLVDFWDSVPANKFEVGCVFDVVILEGLISLKHPKPL